MPEPVLTLARVSVEGIWQARRLRGQARLVLQPEQLELSDGAGKSVPVSYGRLSGASLEQDTLTLYGETNDKLHLSAPAELDVALRVLIEQVCRVPEVTRGLRSLGSGRGGEHEQQSRFFGPFLHARKRLRDAGAMEERMGRIDAEALRQRVVAAIGALAMEHHPSSAPHRRSLQAHLDEAAEPLMERLQLLGHAAAVVTAAGPGERFVAWRAWADELRAVFREADLTWLRMIRHTAEHR